MVSTVSIPPEQIQIIIFLKAFCPYVISSQLSLMFLDAFYITIPQTVVNLTPLHTLPNIVSILPCSSSLVSATRVSKSPRGMVEI